MQFCWYKTLDYNTDCNFFFLHEEVLIPTKNTRMRQDDGLQITVLSGGLLIAALGNNVSNGRTLKGKETNGVITVSNLK